MAVATRFLFPITSAIVLVSAEHRDDQTGPGEGVGVGWESRVAGAFKRGWAEAEW